ncbi:integrase arm-type DNA-binding domain-containing protein [Ancylobacter sp. A5.8]|uniref:tyrosine-type recombinase/integrase n=1 Tax=Ancylobacter gelatini TaxID=2919920 RepID=UPI001F4DDBC0|nr:integrase arm-type DNA-binding domain-containing protein [Ancylobacter gelatini]MCJ8143366.1 integrase arm-type DNA-binding domain-containing protein [Ancylobacter gelatini]
MAAAQGLSHAKIRKAAAGERPYKLTDAGGLNLHVLRTGTRIWRMRYEIAGREKRLTLDPYPDMSLAAAREAGAEARKLLRQGCAGGGALRGSGSRVACALQAHWSDTHAQDVLLSLERDVFAAIGAKDVREITPADAQAVLRAIEARPAIETAKRVRQRISAVFVFAIGSGLATQDPAPVLPRSNVTLF